MKIKASLMAGLIAASPAVFGQDVEVATDPVGYVSVNLLAASDTRISVPMTRAPEFQGVPTAVAGSTITFDGINGAEGADFGDLDGHFIVVRNGDLAGVRATIVSNDANSVTVEDGVDLSGLATGSEGDSVQVIPHWTMATLFPADLPDETIVLLFDADQSGINRGADRIFQYFQDHGWFEGGTEVDDVVVHQGESFLVRDSTGDDINLVIAGSVPMAPHNSTIVTLAADAPQDNHIGFSLPVVVTLAESGIPAAEGDVFLVPANDDAGINKGASLIFQYFEGHGWFEGGTERDNFELQPGVGYTFRKAGGDSPEVVTWSFTPSYLQ